MTTLIKTALVSATALMLSLTPIAATAQSQLSDEQAQQIEQNLEETVARLKLTDAQREAAAPIIEAEARERAKILQDANFERGKRPSLKQLRSVKKPLKDSRTRTDAQLATILSSEQMEELNKIRQERRAQLRKGLSSGS